MPKSPYEFFVNSSFVSSLNVNVHESSNRVSAIEPTKANETTCFKLIFVSHTHVFSEKSKFGYES